MEYQFPMVRMVWTLSHGAEERKTFLQEYGYGIWYSVVIGYNGSKK
jgi:hypothetical protein